jgi:glycosyltransferase involved in cell wall biosynthesis
MRIGLDVRYISHGLTGGVRTYVYHLARELPVAAPQHEFFYYADDKAPFELSGLPANVSMRTLSWRGTLSSVRNDFQLGRWMQSDRLDVAHCPGNYGPAVSMPLVVTLHDTLNVFSMAQHLRGFSRRPRQVAMMLYLGRMTRASLRRAARIVTVSDHARKDIAARTGYPLERITRVYEAAGDTFGVIRDRAVLDDLRARFNVAPRMILADGIKNPGALLAAYDSLPEALRRSTQILFFSREASPRPEVANALGTPTIQFVSRPSTPELVGLMNLATVFAFPSWYEGFGIPLVEAMQCGVPILASTRASIPEIVGDAGVVFDLESPDAGGRLLQQLLEDEPRRRQLAANALERAKLFTWKRAAQETLAVYEDVASALQRTA